MEVILLLPVLMETQCLLLIEISESQVEAWAGKEYKTGKVNVTHSHYLSSSFILASVRHDLGADYIINIITAMAYCMTWCI